MNLAIVVTTLGRLEPLEALAESLHGELRAGDRLVVVAQNSREEVVRIFDGLRQSGAHVLVTTSAPGASVGRNAGVASLPADEDPLVIFPNDTTRFSPGVLDRLRGLPDTVRAGAITVVDENGPKFILPEPGAALTRSNVWSVIEIGLLMRASIVRELGGFDETLGTGASTPWQAGEGTDLLLRFRKTYGEYDYTWLPADVTLLGISDSTGLSRQERRRKLRRYGRGMGRVLTRWRYPLVTRLAFIAAGAVIGFRHAKTHRVGDGPIAALGRLEGVSGVVWGRNSDLRAVSR